MFLSFTSCSFTDTLLPTINCILLLLYISPTHWDGSQFFHSSLNLYSMVLGTEYLLSIWSGHRKQRWIHTNHYLLLNTHFQYILCQGALFILLKQSSLSRPDSEVYEPHWSRELLAVDLFIFWPRWVLEFAEMCDLKIE